MTVRMIMRVATLVGVLLCYAVVIAQTPPQPLKKASPPAKVTNRVDKAAKPPQVVTIVHRLNGLKMFRLLLREEQVQSIASLDSAFNLMDDVHTNVIAGLAMDDGETIAAWLPEADVEFGPPEIVAPAAPRAPDPPSAPKARRPVRGFPRFGGSFFEPDVTVIGPDGKHLAAKYVGLDAVTGLSILQLAKKHAMAESAIKDEPVNAGESVLLYGPEPVTKARSLLSNSLYVRMGVIEGRIQGVMPAPSGGISRFKVRSPKLSHANIGGVATNEAGETLGIIDGLEGNEASILPTALIRRAAERVLAQQASVPRPWLGVRGEAISALNVNQISNHGWELQRAATLAGRHRGILLTSIVPGSPAALAALRAGDVILKVDDKDIQNEADFTWWLEQAGPSSSVQFTVARPDRPSEEPLSVKLSGMLDPTFSFKLQDRLRPPKGFSLIDQGIETVALKPSVASQLGTTAGLLVVYVEPMTAAFEAGIQPGDVIQTINGKLAPSFTPATQTSTFTFELVRNKEKLIVKVVNPPKKK